MGIEEEVQVKVVYSIFSKIIAKKFQNNEKCQFRYRNPRAHQSDMTKIKPLHDILYLKQLAKRRKKKF
jgi:hypothetical protein